jgi:hypothetical protein
MLWIHTTPDATQVIKIKAVRDWTYIEFIASTMGEPLTSIVEKLSIPIAVAIGSP